MFLCLENHLLNHSTGVHAPNPYGPLWICWKSPPKHEVLPVFRSWWLLSSFSLASKVLVLFCQYYSGHVNNHRFTAQAAGSGPMHLGSAPAQPLCPVRASGPPESFPAGHW